MVDRRFHTKWVQEPVDEKTPVSVCPLRQQTLRPPTHCWLHDGSTGGCYLLLALACALLTGALAALSSQIGAALDSHHHRR